MQTLRAAAERLATLRTLDDLASLAAVLGCAGAPDPFDDETRLVLGLGAGVAEARVARGPGALRALLIETRPGVPPGDLLARLAARLQSRTPHVLWLVLALERGDGAIAIAAWHGDRRPPRVAMLRVDRERVMDSDAETLRTLASVRESVDVLTHARWVDVLGREALTRRFYRALESAVARLASEASAGSDAQRSEIALLTASRLLFLSFLEAKGWLDGDRAFLARRFDQCMASGGAAHRRLLLPLFFGTLNTPLRARADAARRLGRIPFLNGGLFSRAAAEKRARAVVFTDASIGALLGDLLGRYRFTAREESSDLSEAAVDPEMLGHAFESLMASHERRESGAFYTPFTLVERVTARGLEQALHRRLSDSLAHRLLAGEPLARGDAERVIATLRSLRVLDPACGSGAFLVHALECIAELLGRAGDARPVAARRRQVLTESVFGVDVNPTAVWICELRLWLSVVIESGEHDPLAVAPLPNLDRNVRVGDSLLAGAFAGQVTQGGGAATARLRARYVRATGSRKERLARELDRLERRHATAALDRELRVKTAARRELAALAAARDLFGDRRRTTSEERAHAETLRRDIRALRSARVRLTSGGALPFSFATHFADLAAEGGFGLVVGNPPWVRPHRVPDGVRRALRREYRCARAAGWELGASLSHAGSGFAAQVDLAAYFVERSLRLLAPGGVLSLLVPVKLWRSLAGGGLRHLLTTEARLVALEDHTESGAAFDAVVYPSLLVAERPIGSGEDTTEPVVTLSAVRHACPDLRWHASAREIGFDDSAGAPWLMLPREVRASFDRVRACSPLLAERVGRPLLGVKCGCNAAFLVRGVGATAGDIEVVGADARRGVLPEHVLRPVLRGEALRAWRRDPADTLIVWTHDGDGLPLSRLEDAVAHWLAPWRRQLTRRTDARGRSRWWSLFRTESAKSNAPRVAWADVGRAPRAVFLESGDPVVPLNSCYVVRCADDTDALALTAWLNSALAAAWLAALAEPARGGYRRYLAWTMALLPLPSEWDRARLALRPVAERAVSGRPPSDVELLEVCLDAARLRRRDVAPLLAWTTP